MNEEDGQLHERARLEAHGIRPRRRFGQNFLVDPRIPELMVTRASWEASAPVLEIGPGGGALTEVLLRAGHPVAAIEKDRDLVPLLEERFASELEDGRFRVREGDALELDWDLGPDPAPSRSVETGARSLAEEARQLPSAARPWIAGNLPYAITTPLLLRALEQRDRFSGALFMVQREYGERILAAPGSKTYGSITVWVRAHAELRSVLKVGRSSFWPRPGVESVVVEFVFVEPPPFSGDRRQLERVVRAAFSQRRKTLANALASGLHLEKSEVLAVLAAAAVSPAVRAETLGLVEFGRIVEALG